MTWKRFLLFPAAFPLLLFFFVGGVIFTITMPDIFIGQIWIAVSVLLGGFFVLLIKRTQAQERVKKEGIPGQAQVLEIEQTGVYVNNQPQVKLRMRIEASAIAPYELEKRVTVPMIALGSLSSGQPLSVFIDRADHENVVVDWSRQAGPATVSAAGGAPIDLNANPAAKQAAIEALRARGLPTDGAVDLRQNPEARAAVLEALRKHGVDVAHGQAAADPSTAVPAESKGEPLDRLTKLMQLRSANLITDAELEEQRKRILSDI